MKVLLHKYEYNLRLMILKCFSFKDSLYMIYVFILYIILQLNKLCVHERARVSSKTSCFIAVIVHLTDKTINWIISVRTIG